MQISYDIDIKEDEKVEHFAAAQKLVQNILEDIKELLDEEAPLSHVFNEEYVGEKENQEEDANPIFWGWSFKIFFRNNVDFDDDTLSKVQSLIAAKENAFVESYLAF